MPTFHRLLPFALSGLVLANLGTGCQTEPHLSSAPDPHASHAAATEKPSTDNNENRFSLETTGAQKSGTNGFRFALLAEDGRLLKPEDLAVVHEKRLHMLLVRDDLTGFQHLHPEYQNDAWETTTDVPAQGDYFLYADFLPAGGEPTVLRQTVRIGGPTTEKKPPEPNAATETMADGIMATLQGPRSFQAGQPTGIAFLLVKDGQPITSIKPYLGTFGHVVILRHGDPETFVHAHPVTEEPPADGTVRFTTTFPVAGRYTLFGQFDAEGSVKTFPITIDVAGSGNTVRMEGHSPHAHH